MPKRTTPWLLPIVILMGCPPAPEDALCNDDDVCTYDLIALDGTCTYTPVDFLNDPMACGSSCAPCPLPPPDLLHALPTCNGGTCGVACAEGAWDADGDPDNGCETRCSVQPSPYGCPDTYDVEAAKACVELLNHGTYPDAFSQPSVATYGPLSTSKFDVSEADGDFACEQTTVDATEGLSGIVTLAGHNIDLVAGAVINAETFVNGGVVQVVPGLRSDMSLVIDAPVDDPWRTASPASLVRLREVDAELRREADRRLGSLPALANQMSVEVGEVSSFGEVLHKTGIQGGFSSPLVSAGLSADFASGRSVREHTIAIKIFQPLFTISAGDDEILTNAGFFADNADFADLCSAAGITETSPAAYVKSVTYGRILIATMTNRNFKSAKDLAVAVGAEITSLGVSGGLEVEHEEEYLQATAESTIRVFALGGSQQDALDGVRTGDFSRFFTPVRAIEAVPISYQINLLAGARPPLATQATTTLISNACTRTDCPPPPSEVEVVDVIVEDHAGGPFGYRNDWEFGDRDCGADWERHEVEVDENRINNGHCEVEWLVDNAPNDCRGTMHMGITALGGMRCTGTITKIQYLPHPDIYCR